MVIIPAKMGRHNKRALLDCMHRLGTASRAELAKSLGLSQPTAGKIADELIELGVFEETEETAPDSSNAIPNRRLGRPARMLRLNQSKARFLGFQLGLEKTTAAPLPLSLHDDENWPVNFDTGKEINEWSLGLRKAAAQIHQKSFWGILVSVPGLVDERKGEILYSPNLHFSEKKALPNVIGKVWRGAPIILIQEERALALGHHASDPEGEDFFLVDFGEGVGGAALISGKLYEHPLPVSGELGHTPVMGNNRRCGCGATGCLETVASIRGLLQSFAEAHPKLPKTWNALSHSVATRGVEPWLAKSLDAMGAGIAGVLNVFGLRRVVVTGALTDLSPSVFSYLTEAINRSALWARFGQLNIEKAPRRRKAGLVAFGIDRLIVPAEAPETGANTPL